MKWIDTLNHIHETCSCFNCMNISFGWSFRTQCKYNWKNKKNPWMNVAYQFYHWISMIFQSNGSFREFNYLPISRLPHYICIGKFMTICFGQQQQQQKRKYKNNNHQRKNLPFSSWFGLGACQIVSICNKPIRNSYIKLLVYNEMNWFNKTISKLNSFILLLNAMKRSTYGICFSKSPKGSSNNNLHANEKKNNNKESDGNGRRNKGVKKRFIGAKQWC